MPGHGETLANFEVHLKNRIHRQRVRDRFATASRENDSNHDEKSSSIAHGIAQIKFHPYRSNLWSMYIAPPKASSLKLKFKNFTSRIGHLRQRVNDCLAAIVNKWIWMTVEGVRKNNWWISVWTFGGKHTSTEHLLASHSTLLNSNVNWPVFLCHRYHRKIHERSCIFPGPGNLKKM